MKKLTSSKALETLLMKNIYLEDKSEYIKALNFDDKRVYASYLLSEDEPSSFDGVHELKGELNFNSETFEDGIETTTKNNE